MQILFNGTESTFGYFEATRRYIDQHGKPLAFYSDKASIFRVNKASATGGDGHTQYGRALFELNIDGICANTPAAKGRVERAHLTMQDRLVKELRLEGISTIEAANAFMPTYVDHYNAQRPHRTLQQNPPAGRVHPPPIGTNIRVLRRDRLGGLIHEYAQVA